MPRSIWKGAISFGLVNVPVSLYSAERPQELRFNQLDRRTMSRVREKRVDEKTGQEVPYEEIVKGYDTGGGQYVVLTDEELKRANPKASQTVSILGFVSADEIDITYFVKPFYLAPDRLGQEGLRAAASRAARHPQGGHRQGGHPHQGVSLRRDRAGRPAGTGDPALRLRAARRIRARRARRRPRGARPDQARDHHGRAVDRGHGHLAGTPRPTATSTATTCSG